MTHAYMASPSSSDASDDPQDTDWLMPSSIDDFEEESHMYDDEEAPSSSSASLGKRASSCSDLDAMARSSKYRRVSTSQSAHGEDPTTGEAESLTKSSRSLKKTPLVIHTSRRQTSKSKQQSFVQKLYRMATCPDHADVFGFSADGAAVEIRCSVNLGPVLMRYFKHGNTSSFIRQLNNYGFKTIPSAAPSSFRLSSANIQSFAHPNFHRDAKDEVDQITRKTAKTMKRSKREFIRELQSGDTEQRRRLHELQTTNQDLLVRNQNLEFENLRLRDEIQMLHQHIRGINGGNNNFSGGRPILPGSSESLPSLVSNSSRRSSFEPDTQSDSGTDFAPSDYYLEVPSTSSTDTGGRVDAMSSYSGAPLWFSQPHQSQNTLNVQSKSAPRSLPLPLPEIF